MKKRCAQNAANLMDNVCELRLLLRQAGAHCYGPLQLPNETTKVLQHVRSLKGDPRAIPGERGEANSSRNLGAHQSRISGTQESDRRGRQENNSQAKARQINGKLLLHTVYRFRALANTKLFSRRSTQLRGLSPHGPRVDVSN